MAGNYYIPTPQFGSSNYLYNQLRNNDTFGFVDKYAQKRQQINQANLAEQQRVNQLGLAEQISDANTLSDYASLQEQLRGDKSKYSVKGYSALSDLLNKKEQERATNLFMAENQGKSTAELGKLRGQAGRHGVLDQSQTTPLIDKILKSKQNAEIASFNKMQRDKTIRDERKAQKKENYLRAVWGNKDIQETANDKSLTERQRDDRILEILDSSGLSAKTPVGMTNILGEVKNMFADRISLANKLTPEQQQQVNLAKTMTQSYYDEEKTKLNDQMFAFAMEKLGIESKEKYDSYMRFKNSKQGTFDEAVNVVAKNLGIEGRQREQLNAHLPEIKSFINSMGGTLSTNFEFIKDVISGINLSEYEKDGEAKNDFGEHIQLSSGAEAFASIDPKKKRLYDKATQDVQNRLKTLELAQKSNAPVIEDIILRKVKNDGLNMSDNKQVKSLFEEINLATRSSTNIIDAIKNKKNKAVMEATKKEIDKNTSKIEPLPVYMTSTELNQRTNSLNGAKSLQAKILGTPYHAKDKNLVKAVNDMVNEFSGVNEMFNAGSFGNKSIPEVLKIARNIDSTAVRKSFFGFDSNQVFNLRREIAKNIGANGVNDKIVSDYIGRARSLARSIDNVKTLIENSTKQEKNRISKLTFNRTKRTK